MARDPGQPAQTFASIGIGKGIVGARRARRIPESVLRKSSRGGRAKSDMACAKSRSSQ